MNLHSKKHHYIPEFFSKAFTDEKGFLWIYDKEKNQILRNQKHPANIFFEDYLNSIEINGEKVAFIEEMYNGVNKIKGPDQYFSESVKALQNSTNDEIAMTTERISHLIYFIAQLTWRVPANEAVNKILLNYISHKDPMLYSALSQVSWLSQQDQFKMARFITPSMMFREAHKILIPGKLKVKIIDFHQPVFCLSDNPIIWKTFPAGATDFTTPLIFPINKQKVFVITEESEYYYSTNDLKLTIMILMHQAKKYVAFHSREGLQQYVNAYQEYKQIGSNQRGIVQGLFERINKMEAVTS